LFYPEKKRRYFDKPQTALKHHNKTAMGFQWQCVKSQTGSSAVCEELWADGTSWRANPGQIPDDSAFFGKSHRDHQPR
jgi:hypothetical protein